MDKQYNKYLEERLKGVFPVRVGVAPPVDTEMYEAPFLEKEFDKILRTSDKNVRASAVRGGIDQKGDIYAWRFDIPIRSMIDAHDVKFDYEIEAIRQGSKWNLLVKPVTMKGSIDEEDIPNIDEKIGILANRFPGEVPVNYMLSMDIGGRNTEERKVPL